MKRAGFIIAFLFPFMLMAQSEHIFALPPSSKTRLLNVDDHLIFIEPLDGYNLNQKWLTLDSSLNIISSKKLVTPGAGNLIRQNYIQGNHAIIRIDQALNRDILQLSAFIFDIQGNLIYANDLVAKTSHNKGILPSPFLIAQSPNKKSFALMQPQINEKDSLSVAAIVFDDTLGIKTNAMFTVPYNKEMYEIHMPLLNDNETVFLPVVERFESYRISSQMEIHALTRGSETAKRIDLTFDRKKIKNLRFTPTNEALLLTALFSSSKEDKEDVTGILHSNIALANGKMSTNEYAYSSYFKQQLRRTFAGDNRRGSVLNFLSVLPGAFIKQQDFNHAIVLPGQSIPNLYTEPKKAPPPNTDLANIKQDLWYAASLVGSQPPGYSRPMDVAEASVYARTYTRVVSTTSSNPSSSNVPMSIKSIRKPITPSKNLLYYAFTEDAVDREFRFIKFKPVNDGSLSFFAYYNNSNGTGAIHYVEPSLKKPYLKATFITSKGEVIEKKIFEDKNKIILAQYGHLIINDHLYAFTIDKATGVVSLIKLAL